MLIEVCTNSLESALNAQKVGADRIELCAELGLGGITPSFGLLKSIREKIKIPVHVLIRPRSGDFLYSDLEFDAMLNDIKLCVDLGFDGIVSGVLCKDFSIDIDRVAMLKEASENLKFTFHRAFDWVNDPILALSELEKIGVDYILSSGQKTKAIEGIELLSLLNQKSSHCTIMPGSGINAENGILFKEKDFKIIHLSAAVFHEKNANKQSLPMSYLPFLAENKVVVSDSEIIRLLLNRVK
tara:strand:+ start:355229 stop:355951 length:723 start_codon:yes stop_codon:yes gene_type:complete